MATLRLLKSLERSHVPQFLRSHQAAPWAMAASAQLCSHLANEGPASGTPEAAAPAQADRPAPLAPPDLNPTFGQAVVQAAMDAKAAGAASCSALRGAHPQQRPAASGSAPAPAHGTDAGLMPSLSEHRHQPKGEGETRPDFTPILQQWYGRALGEPAAHRKSRLSDRSMAVLSGSGPSSQSGLRDPYPHLWQRQAAASTPLGGPHVQISSENEISAPSAGSPASSFASDRQMASANRQPFPPFGANGNATTMAQRAMEELASNAARLTLGIPCAPLQHPPQAPSQEVGLKQQAASSPPGGHPSWPSPNHTPQASTGAGGHPSWPPSEGTPAAPLTEAQHPWLLSDGCGHGAAFESPLGSSLVPTGQPWDQSPSMEAPSVSPSDRMETGGNVKGSDITGSPEAPDNVLFMNSGPQGPGYGGLGMDGPHAAALGEVGGVYPNFVYVSAGDPGRKSAPMLTQKKLRRLMSNRASAKRSRKRRLDRLQELEVLAVKLRTEQAEVQHRLTAAQEEMRHCAEENQGLRAEVERMRGRVKQRGGALRRPLAIFPPAVLEKPDESAEGNVLRLQPPSREVRLHPHMLKEQRSGAPCSRNERSRYRKLHTGVERKGEEADFLEYLGCGTD